ncbi:hypothetical protein PRUPE_4G066700 [Prunus persica]|uniref:Uncharacterized protein n=1 Tax=Prunus persica TaxID=3760 RepID=M5X615_PRUPE|nr:hypothetical protein PRUPE_4G066700 [Prunus persica]
MPISVNGSSVTLNDFTQKNFPEEFAERKLQNDTMTNFGVDSMPLFVMDVVLPFHKFPLRIFEPRYRLMVRRIMEGNLRMGMVITDSSTGSIAEFACEVEITEFAPLPDGRFHLEEIACFVKLEEYWLNPTSKDLIETRKIWKYQ